MSTVTDPDPPCYEPMAVIAAGLAAHARGEEVDQDAMEDAALLVCTANLVARGIPAETVERWFRDRDYEFRFTYDGADDELGVSVEFLDGEQ